MKCIETLSGMLDQEGLSRCLGSARRPTETVSSGSKGVAKARAPLLHLLEDYLARGNAEEMTAAVEALEAIFGSDEGRAIYEGLGPHMKGGLTPYLPEDRTHWVLVGKEEVEAPGIPDPGDAGIWMVRGGEPRSYETWVCGVVCSLLSDGTMAANDAALKACRGMARLSAKFSEALLPFALAATVLDPAKPRQKEQSREAKAKVARHQTGRKFLFPNPNPNPKPD